MSTSAHDLDATLAAWIRTFRGPLVGMIATWTRDFGRAEELAQDTFAEAWISRERFRGALDDMAAVGAWLRGIAFHLHAGDVRRETRARARVRDAAANVAPVGADASQDPAAERRAVLDRAMARLRESHRVVLQMHYLEATTARDVAALLGVTVKAVEGRLYQARRALRDAVERELRAATGGRVE